MDTASEPGRIRLAYGVSWPTTYDRANAVEIRFVAGTTAANVPENLKAAIKVLAAELHEFREESVTGTIINRVEKQINRLLWKDRIVEFA